MSAEREHAESSIRHTKQNIRRVGNLIAIIFLSVTALVALSFCIFLLLRIEGLKEEEEELKESLISFEELAPEEEQMPEGTVSAEELQQLLTQEREEAQRQTTSRMLDYVRTQFAEGNSSVWMLRNLYGTFSNEVVVGSGGTFFFFPKDESLKKAIVEPKELSPGPDGRMLYSGSDPRVSGEFGIDVSRFQGEIDWKKVAEDGVKFAFIRAGARGSSEGKFIEDGQFTANIEGALENGIKVGVYFYTQAVNEEEALEEADYCIEVLRPYEIELPVVFDLEPADSEGARTNELTKEQNTTHVLTFCNRISEAGYQPMLYGGLKSFFMMLNMEELEHLKKWFAFYDDMPYFPYEYSYWQYSSKGRVAGIDGDVDLDICIEDLAR